MGGGTLTPSLELGIRRDAGDAETGTGIDAGAGLRYARDRMTLEGSLFRLVAHQASGYEEWGASAGARIEPGRSGQGLLLRLTPAWGAAGGGARQFRDQGDAPALAPPSGSAAGWSLDAEIGYGFGLAGAPGKATPYFGLSRAQGAGWAWRGGARWALTPGATLGLEATEGGAPGRGATVRFTARW